MEQAAFADYFESFDISDEEHGLWDVDPLLDFAATDPGQRYRPLLGSPVIDQGINDFASPLDLAGQPRIQDGDGDGAAVVDLGPFEFQP